MGVDQILLLVLAGLVAGFAGGLFGIGGGVIIVPALYGVFSAHGVPEEVCIKLAVGTSLATIIVTSVRSLQAHHRNGHVEWSILKFWGPFIAMGSVGGAILARTFSAPVLLGFFAVCLFALAVDKLRRSGAGSQAGAGRLPSIGVQRGLAGGTGLVSSLVGIGGGVIGVTLLTRAGLSVHRAVGTASGFGFAIAVPGTLGYMLTGLGQTGAVSGAIGYVSLVGLAGIAAGTALAAPWGAAAANRLDAVLLTRIFAVYMIVTSIFMMRDALAL